MEEALNYILYSCKEGVAKITFNRPPLNILNIEMMKEINNKIADLQFNTEIKLIVFNAVGKAFSAGVSVEDHTEDKAAQMIDEFHKVFRLLNAINIPTLAVVQGYALGGACELVAFCDLAIAAESSKFGQPEIKVGVFPPIAAIIFPYIMGMKKTMELLLKGDIISAKEALNLNLINKVVPDDKLEEEANKMIKAVTSNSSVIIQFTKQAVYKTRLMEFNEALRVAENIYLVDMMQTEDAKEGINAFLQKRNPQWKNK